MKFQKLFMWSWWMTVIIWFSLKGRQSFIVLFLFHLRWNFTRFIFYREFWLSKTFNNAGNPYEAILFSRIFFPENIPKWLLIFSNWSREQNIFLHTRGFFLSGLFMVGNSLISISLVFYIWFQSGLSKFRFDVHIFLLKSVTSNNLGAHSCT